MAKQTFSTPVGLAVYPRLKSPDTKFHDLGIYKADLSVPLTEAEPLMKKLNEVHKAFTGKPAKKNDNSMWYFETDEAGEETGNVIFKMRVKNLKSKKTGEVWDRRPVQFDAQLKPIDVNPYGGTKMIVSFEPYEWVSGDKKGVSLQPVGVQILELVTGTGPSASAMGFAAQDGYAGIGSEYGGDDDEDDEDEDEYSSDDDDAGDDGDY